MPRMEDGKLSWSDTQGLDRIRRAHAQKNIGFSEGNNSSNGTKFGKNKDLGFICKFFQIGTCSHSKDHISGGRKGMYVPTVKVAILQKSAKMSKKNNQKTSKALQICSA